MPVDLDATPTNPSDNEHFGEVVSRQLARRTLLGGALGVAAVGFLDAGVAQAADLTTRRPGRELLGFAGIAPSDADEIVVPPGYAAQVLIPWGTPLFRRGPSWNKDASDGAAEQELQVGSHHDGMHFFPSARRPNSQGLLVVNHEYVDPVLLTEDGNRPMTPAKVDKALAAHGVTVIAIERGRDGQWQHADSRYNRRVTGNTPMAFSGPVRGSHPELQANDEARGTLNNCANGYTPWDTYLTCEENWNNYFGTTDRTWTASVEEKRYGIVASGGGYDWHLADPRFDVSANPREANRFGWVVEIDPMRPGSRPVKRTALGRFKHEGACVVEKRGRLVVYMGDDQDKEYIYRYVSDRPWRQARAHRRSPLDEGTLYVAKFADDGTGTWLPLTHGEGPLTVANGWADQADVMLRTRTAADALGATKMDRPEWIAENPRNGDLYVTLTNGSSGPTPPNPRLPNPYGHIIRWRESRSDWMRFTWEIFVLAGDPHYDPQVTIDGDIFGSPDGLGFDPDGRLWILTDVSNSVQNLASRGHDRIKNNQMLAADPTTREIRRFLVGPRGCEITGFSITPDRTSMFVNVQHPGEQTSAWGTPTPEQPQVVSSWPDHDPDGRPRSATVVITKIGGGVIGS